MKILLTCSSGTSAGFLERAMNTYIEKEGIKDTVVDAKGVEYAKQDINKYDIVLLAPQVQYELNDFLKISNNKVPIELMERKPYADCKVTSIFRQIKLALK